MRFVNEGLRVVYCRADLAKGFVGVDVSISGED